MISLPHIALPGIQRFLSMLLEKTGQTANCLSQSEDSEAFAPPGDSRQSLTYQY